MSGYTEIVLGDHGILNPAINFLQKPFKHLELALKMREVLDTRTEPAGETPEGNP